MATLARGTPEGAVLACSVAFLGKARGDILGQGEGWSRLPPHVLDLHVTLMLVFTGCFQC